MKSFKLPIIQDRLIAEPAGKTAGGEEEFNPLTQKNLTTRKGEK